MAAMLDSHYNYRMFTYQCLIVLCLLHLQPEPLLPLPPFLLDVSRPIKERVIIAVIEVFILPILLLLLPTLCE